MNKLALRALFVFLFAFVILSASTQVSFGQAYGKPPDFSGKFVASGNPVATKLEVAPDGKSMNLVVTAVRGCTGEFFATGMLTFNGDNLRYSNLSKMGGLNNLYGSLDRGEESSRIADTFFFPDGVPDGEYKLVFNQGTIYTTFINQFWNGLTGAASSTCPIGTALAPFSYVETPTLYVGKAADKVALQVLSANLSSDYLNDMRSKGKLQFWVMNPPAQTRVFISQEGTQAQNIPIDFDVKDNKEVFVNIGPSGLFQGFDPTKPVTAHVLNLETGESRSFTVYTP